jgi:hypothetical protein
MSSLIYINQLISEATQGIESLCHASLAADEVDRSVLVAAVRSQVEIKNDHDFRRLPKECQDFLGSVERSSDRDLLAVITKTLRSVRLAAFTHIIGKDAVYEDQPLYTKS